MNTSSTTLTFSSVTPGSCLIICSNGKKSSAEPKTSMPMMMMMMSKSCPAVNISVKVQRRKKVVSCQAISTASVDKDEKDESVSGSVEAAEEAKVGSKVKVNVPLKVYHVPKVPEIDLKDKEGVIKQYVGLWKGKKISANLPFKVQFVTEIEGRGPVKFFAHLREDELEFLD